MTLRAPKWPQGRLVRVEHTSQILKDNPLGDPHVRQFDVWLPPQYDANSAANMRFPVMYDLVAFTGAGPSHTNWQAFEENVPQRLARLLHDKKIGPCIVVFPNCFTAFGGNQYINSSAIGHYADYLTKEIVPFIDHEFRTLADRNHRACFGKSSGGYGAIVHGMKYPKVWGAIADHSGDAAFELTFQHWWLVALTELGKYRRPANKPGAVDVLARLAKLDDGDDDGRVKRFLRHVWGSKPGLPPSSDETLCLLMLAQAASYDPDPLKPLGFQLPLNLETGEFISTRWRQWRRHDPVHMAKRYQKNLTTLKLIYIDCGWRDNFHLHFGNRLLSAELARLGVDHHYQEFDGTHSKIDKRMDMSLPLLYQAIKA